MLTRLLALLGFAALVPIAFMPMTDAVHPMLKRVLCIASASLFALAVVLYLVHRRRSRNRENPT